MVDIKKRDVSYQNKEKNIHITHRIYLFLKKCSF